MIIPAALLAEIRREAEAAYPAEACGLLLGAVCDGAVRVEGRHTVANRRIADGAAQSRYLITADDYRSGSAAAQAAGWNIVGVYHSHPDAPARPSVYDREHAWPWYRYVIVSVRRGRAQHAAVWRLREDRSGFTPEPIRLTANIDVSTEGSVT